MYPNDRHYSREHEWVLLEGDGKALVGITTYAQEQLGDVVFVDLPKPSTKLHKYEKLGEVESVKAVSDIYSPIAGVVVEINQDVIDNPELVNEDSLGKGWMVRMDTVDTAQLGDLLSASEYDTYLAQLE
ncbi:glycine cleavage system protein GcvH [Dehalococcoidia bacterium]|nr:glycine cleavage system protein GcvH [Dehalococcoidia bacterium]